MAAYSLIVPYQLGELSVVGFGVHEALDFVNLSICQAELLDVIKKNKVLTLAIDLTDVAFIPSGLLGVIASMKKLVHQVLVFNCSDEIRDVFEVTRLDQVVKLCEVDIHEAN
jgi:anti-anti-sigma factor